MSTKKHHIVFIRVVPDVFWILLGALYWHWHRSTLAVRQNGHIIRVIPYNWQAVYYPPCVIPDYILPLLHKMHQTYTLYCWFGFKCNVSLLMKIVIIMSENVFNITIIFKATIIGNVVVIANVVIIVIIHHRFNTLRPRQYGRPFPENIFKCILLNANVWISLKISLKFVPINTIPASVQIMAWRRPGDKPLSGPMMVKLPTHICATRPQWVNYQVKSHLL